MPALYCSLPVGMPVSPRGNCESIAIPCASSCWIDHSIQFLLWAERDAEPALSIQNTSGPITFADIGLHQRSKAWVCLDQPPIAHEATMISSRRRDSSCSRFYRIESSRAGQIRHLSLRPLGSSLCGPAQQTMLRLPECPWIFSARADRH